MSGNSPLWDDAVNGPIPLPDDEEETERAAEGVSGLLTNIGKSLIGQDCGALGRPSNLTNQSKSPGVVKY